MAGNYSDDLIHFTKHDPVPTGGKVRERSKLEQDIEAFLANGGQITEHGTESGVHYPIRRTRAAQINLLKRLDYGRRKKR